MNVPQCPEFGANLGKFGKAVEKHCRVQKYFYKNAEFREWLITEKEN